MFVQKHKCRIYKNIQLLHKKKQIRETKNVKLITMSKINFAFLFFIFYRQSFNSNSHFDLQGYTFIETLKQLSQYVVCQQ